MTHKLHNLATQTSEQISEHQTAVHQTRSQRAHGFCGVVFEKSAAQIPAVPVVPVGVPVTPVAPVVACARCACRACCVCCACCACRVCCACCASCAWTFPLFSFLCLLCLDVAPGSILAHAFLPGAWCAHCVIFVSGCWLCLLCLLRRLRMFAVVSCPAGEPLWERS